MNPREHYRKLAFSINDEQRAEYLKKQQAIKLILAAKADGSMA